MAKRMKIGAMRERVDIIQPVETVNDLGEKTETWEQQFVNVSAEVEYKSSQTDERYEAAKGQVSTELFSGSGNGR